MCRISYTNDYLRFFIYMIKSKKKHKIYDKINDFTVFLSFQHNFIMARLEKLPNLNTIFKPSRNLAPHF